jgi:hypothetical protein
VDDRLLTIAGDYWEERADELAMLLKVRMMQALDSFQFTLVDFSFGHAVAP